MGCVALLLLAMVGSVWAAKDTASTATTTRIGLPGVVSQLSFESNGIVFVQPAQSALFDVVGSGVHQYHILRLGNISPELSFLGGDMPSDVGQINLANYMNYWNKWPNSTVNAILMTDSENFFRAGRVLAYFIKVSAPVRDKADKSMVYRISSASSAVLTSGLHKHVYLILQLPKSQKS